MSVTAPAGFVAAGAAVGIKSSGGKDLALVVNQGPAFDSASVFTANRCKANPVLWSEQVVKDGIVKAVVLNSGGANCYTGAEGFLTTHQTAERVAEHLGIGAGDVVVCSTGLIGLLNIREHLLAGVDAAAAALSGDGGPAAAEAIMTTDTVSKQVVVEGDPSTSSGQAAWSIGGMAKGAGMLAPALATMLVVLTTDAVAGAGQLDAALRAATAKTFDGLDSDGCMSTNDTVLLLASGASQAVPDPGEFAAAVEQVCQSLAEQLIDDCEGASKVIAIEVTGAASDDDAVEVARAVSRSNLLKCAIHGEDPNWGRILAAVGTTGAAFDADQVDVAINGVWICKGSTIGDDRSGVDLSNRRVEITVELHAGESATTLLTNDLTADYVHENSAYST